MTHILSKHFGVYIDLTDTGRPYYVGKGTQERINNLKDRNVVHERISSKHGQNRKIVFETDDEQQAFQKERELISELKTWAHGGPDCWGANLTQGGEGTSGHRHSDETKRRIGDIHRGKTLNEALCEEISKRQKQLWQDPIHREKMSHRQRRSFTDKDRALFSKALAERWQDQVQREKLLEAFQAKWTPELRAQHSVSATKRWSDPKQRVLASIAAKERWQNPVQLAVKSQISRDLWLDPSYREKLSKPRKCKLCGEFGHMAKTCAESLVKETGRRNNRRAIRKIIRKLGQP